LLVSGRYPSKFAALPTPPGATDAAGKPLPTNVKAGEAGSRVLFWAHGSAFAVLQATPKPAANIPAV